MKVKLPHVVSKKRRALLAKWLEKAMAATTNPVDPSCFMGMGQRESKEVKEVLDDLYTVLVND